MTAAHAFEYEVPPHAPAPADAVDAAEGGQVVYLTRHGQMVAAVVPLDVATAGYAAVTALEDAADIREAREALARIRSGEPTVAHPQVLATYASDLAAYPDEQ
jgi:antitoxin (DNA-binding transcriptional repressor) of toxin-antitoxin stability system